MIPGLNGGSKGIRTPDPLHAMQVRYRAAPWTHLSYSRYRECNFSRLLHRGHIQDHVNILREEAADAVPRKRTELIRRSLRQIRWWA
jgi:hypothetical protein